MIGLVEDNSPVNLCQNNIAAKEKEIPFDCLKIILQCSIWS